MEYQKCDNKDCNKQITMDKPPFNLVIEESIKHNYPITFNANDVSFCSEVCMQSWLNDNRRGLDPHDPRNR